MYASAQSTRPFILAAILASFAAAAQAQEPLAEYIRKSYTKREAMIPTRDGAKLFTAIYAPKDAAKKYPFIMMRTPYSSGPYGEANFPDLLGPSETFAREGYIFVYQDVRGRFMSEGNFVNMTPHVSDKRGPKDIDESTDAYDTIEWLLKNVPNHNGRVGQWGISYPGFYSSASMIDAHPALKAVSPQAPIADWFFDDFFHHGAFFLPHCFNFFGGFGKPRPQPTSQWSPGVHHGTPDGYQFFLDLGSLRNVNERWYKGEIAFWNDIIAHPNYDAFWQARNILPHLKRVAPAVMVVGGWFDAEDLYGALQTYQAIERQNPRVFNVLVMGPWRHGGWSRASGDRLGNIVFGAPTSHFYRDEIEAPFFRHFLKDEGKHNLPEAYMFETGANQWRKFDHWPPADARPDTLYFGAGGRLNPEAPAAGEPDFDEFTSDPAKPVPFAEVIEIGMTGEYMTDDQRFAGRRPDVLVYQTPVLDRNVTLAGPLVADLWVSTTAGDADWVVKLIDVYPPSAEDYPGMRPGVRLGNYWMMVRSEVFRGRFRNSYEKPEPFAAGKVERVQVPLQDVLHTFRAGHRIMVQVQSTWFPLVDRNPQKWVDNIFEAGDDDFVQATHRVYRAGEHRSAIRFGVLP